MQCILYFSMQTAFPELQVKAKVYHSHICSLYNYISVHHKPFRHSLTNWLASPFILELLMDYAITVPVSFSTVFMRWLLLVCFSSSLMLTRSLAAAVLRIICQNKGERLSGRWREDRLCCDCHRWGT